MNHHPEVRLSDEVTLHLIRPEDHDRHLSLMQRIYPPAFAYLWPDDGAWYVENIHGAKRFFRELATPGAPYYHVYLGDHLVGIFRLQLHAPCPDFPDEPALKIDRIYLADAVRGRGIGGLLVAYARAETQRLGKNLLWLERMDTNEATIAFYRKHGFTDGNPFRLTMDLMYEELRGMRRVWWRTEG